MGTPPVVAYIEAYHTPPNLAIVNQLISRENGKWDEGLIERSLTVRLGGDESFWILEKNDTFSVK